MLDGKVGPLLAYWRNLRRMSQLALAAEAEVSPRHLSFIESGRANPSREMVLLLAGVLDVPLRERNTLLQAAGFAAAYRESPLAAPQLEAVRQALEAILAQHRPYPAVVLDRRWNIVATNAGAERFFGYLLAGSSADRLGPANVLG
jgi:transcriptional regulator with XRE-family HTH domain